MCSRTTSSHVYSIYIEKDQCRTAGADALGHGRHWLTYAKDGDISSSRGPSTLMCNLTATPPQQMYRNFWMFGHPYHSTSSQTSFPTGMASLPNSNIMTALSRLS